MGFLREFFGWVQGWRICVSILRIEFAYCEGVGTSPAQSVESSVAGDTTRGSNGIDDNLLEELWDECEGANCGLERGEFKQILLNVGSAGNFGPAQGLTASRQQQSAYLRGLKLGDLVLARACAAGKERAWERFLALYRQPLARAAIAITGSETLGHDLADQLYAELFGMTTQDGERRCPLQSYRGRGSLIGWLRTTLAQRHVDHYRRRHREQALEEYDAPAPDREPEKPAAELTLLQRAVERALQRTEPDDRLLLAAYYLDGRTLLQIAGVFHIHEATASRKLRRVCQDLQKQILKNLQGTGLSRRAAEEALGTDPRDLDVKLQRLLQNSQSEAFQEQPER
jgi:RNA polymerase sigma-70 factor (ECF subfamily)